ncbi:MAG: IS630 family transposase [Candidatus Accumulibacter sp.]|jgi:transposase|nr:IS630 family transposase [Accumulibacter sp.]
MKRDGRTLAHNTLEEMRLLAVQRMAEGAHPDEVAASFGMHRTWAYKIRALARDHGVNALRSSKGTGRPKKLSAAQEQQVLYWIDGKSPRHYGFDAELWTRQTAGERILREFGISLSLASVGALLARLKLTSRKPLPSVYRQTPQAIERWRQQSYPLIARQAHEKNAEICFWDESELLSDTAKGAKNQAHPTQDSGSEQNLHAARAVSAKGAFWVATCTGELTGALFVELLEKLMRHRKKSLHLVVSGQPVHREAVVENYVADTNGKLSLHFLPGARQNRGSTKKQ